MNDRDLNVLVFGASGMLGQGVVRQCLDDPAVKELLLIARGTSGLHNAKLREIIHSDFLDYSALEAKLRGFDACFFCLGVSSAGLSEDAYRRITFDVTLAAANTLARLNPQMTFVYVSGAGTDSSGAGKVMWARIKGRTENALLALPFKAAYMLRPGIIQPLNGVKSKTRSYRMLYAVLAPVLPLVRIAFPNQVTTSVRVARAMLGLAKQGFPKAILSPADINSIGE